MSTKWTMEEIDRRYRELLGDETDDSPSARKRRRILRAAHELFLLQGFRKTSIDDIARKAEVAKGTVYLYFESKGQLLVHAIGMEKTTLRSRVVPMFDGTIPKKDRLRHWLVLSYTAARELPLTAKLMTGDADLLAALDELGEGELAARTAEGAEFVGELIEDAAPGLWTPEERRARADVLIGLGFLAGKLLDSRIRGQRTLDEIATTLADIIVRGVGGEGDKT